MKILIVQETDWLKRNPHQQHHLAEMMSPRGHEIRVIDYEFLWQSQGRKELWSRRKVVSGVSKIHGDASITVVRPGIIKVPWLDYISLVCTHRREIARQLAEFRPDVIIGLGILNSYLSARAAAKKIPFVYYWIDVLHGLIPFKPFQVVGKFVESMTLKKSDRVLTINEKLRDYVIALGARPEKTTVLGAGIDFQRFNQDVDGKIVREQCCINKNDIVLFFMGWIYDFSGLKEVALQMAENKRPDVKLLVVGEGDGYEELQMIREKHKLQDRIILTGKKPYDEIPTYISASDICLLPAYSDEKIMQNIVPIKLYEYLAMKKPVIATGLPAVMREFGEENGVVYVDRPEAVISKALELVKNDSLKTLGLKARCFVERRSWDAITDEFEKILAEAIKEKQHERVSE
ncbi:glycosyltransferase [Chloroflexota bacterium]